jgi:OHCU decarboxylase
VSEEIKRPAAQAGIMWLNALTGEAATAELLKCCGSTRWAQQMVAARPFRDLPALLKTAERLWWALDPPDWLEAFRSHPKIGEKKAERHVSADAHRWSDEEQAGTRGAPPEILAALAEANRAYEEKFGYIFIVCAAGKTSEEMLALLRQRLSNGADAELRIAAAEQSRITQLRLEKLLKR